MKYLFVALFIICLLGSCKKKETYHQLTIDINHVFDGQDVTFNSLSLENQAGNILSFYTFKYLISEIELSKSDGESLVLENKYAFVDPINNRSRFVLDSIPEGEYTAIKLTIGLDDAANKSNPNLYTADHPLSPTLNNMHWNWNSGYIFLSMEGQYKADANATNTGAFSYHIAFDENRMPFDFANLNLMLDANKKVRLQFDLAAIFNAPNLINVDNGNVSHSSGDNGLANNISTNVKSSLTYLNYE
ncbi:MAG: hypothetical protein MK212_05345 [Saprospiraceae bacterium]|nr:hypothetical protein [Saprospiraceae bacterium]